MKGIKWMEISYKSITHERKEDAPFVGALICAKGCSRKCKGCFNKSLKKEPNIVKSAEDIVAEIKSNPFNDGVIFAGLEWSEQPQELIELASVASKAGLQIMIYTGNDLSTFQNIIGKSCADKVGYKEELSTYMISSSDDGIYTFIGAMVLDYMIKEDYYIKAGEYDQTKLVDDNTEFGVKLASSNQRIYKFVTVREEIEDGKTEERNTGTDYITSGAVQVGGIIDGCVGETTTTESKAG